MTIDELPETIDRSGVSNTPAAIANFCLKTVIPRLNEVIENQREIIKEVRDEDPVTDGTPGQVVPQADAAPNVDVEAGGDGATQSPDEIFVEQGMDTASSGDPSEAMEDMQALSGLLEDLDSRAASNLGQNDLADADTLRTTTDEELRQVDYVAETALEKIREVFPYTEDEE